MSELVPAGVVNGRPQSVELDAWAVSVPGRVDAVRVQAVGDRAARLDLSGASLGVLAEVALKQADVGFIVVGEQSEARSAVVAHVGTVAIAAHGGEWVLLPGPADHENPFVGRPLVERVDSDGDRRATMLHSSVDTLLQTRSLDSVERVVTAYSM